MRINYKQNTWIIGIVRTLNQYITESMIQSCKLLLQLARK